MTPFLYFQCFLAATLGGMVHAAVKANELKGLAKKSNVEFSLAQFFKDDWLTMAGNQFFILLCLMIADEWLNFEGGIVDKIKTLFAFVGFGGSSIGLALFSQAKKRLYSAIDYKTTIADEANGTTDTPTPATKP